MPRASSDWQVFDLDRVEDGLVEILNAAEIKTFGKRTTFKRTSPSVRLALETRAIQGQRKTRFPTIQNTLCQPYSAWNFTLKALIETNRTNNGLDHRRTLAEVRARLSYYWLTLTFDSTASPYHSITDIREDEVINEFDQESNIDRTEVTFSGMLNVRDDVWPLSIN